ncbi:MAG: hypothetical protein OQJ95_10055 [Kangiella sp.]|nr:hypothetical protein [Kangiella sp.]MCW9029664.1 hypothetical protein [Kangiella sp.]
MMERPLLTFPEIGVDGFEFYLETNHDTGVSPFTNRQHINMKDGTHWVCSLQFSDMDVSESKLLMAFLWECDGPIGTFYLPDYMYQTKQEPVTHPKVAAAGQSGRTLATKDWPANTTVLVKGDYIEVAGQLRGVRQDVVSDGSGLADIPMSHRFYSTPALDDSVNYWNPKALFMLPNNSQTRRRTNNVMRSNFRLQVVEAIL